LKIYSLDRKFVFSEKEVQIRTLREY